MSHVLVLIADPAKADLHDSTVAAVRAALESWSLIVAVLQWIETYLGASFRSFVGPLIVPLASRSRRAKAFWKMCSMEVSPDPSEGGGIR